MQKFLCFFYGIEGSVIFQNLWDFLLELSQVRENGPRRFFEKDKAGLKGVWDCPSPAEAFWRRRAIFFSNSNPLAAYDSRQFKFAGPVKSRHPGESRGPVRALVVDNPGFRLRRNDGNNFSVTFYETIKFVVHSTTRSDITDRKAL
jgi:hypothetical protein